VIAIFPGFQTAPTPSSLGGGGGANGADNPGGGSMATETGAFYNTGATFTVPAGVTVLRIRCFGAGGGGSDYGPGGPGGYAEALVDVTPGEVCSVSVSAGGAYGANGGTGGAKTTFTCAAGTITAGGGGGAGGLGATLGSQGTNSGTVGSNGGTGNNTDAGDGGDNFITGSLSNQVLKGSSDRVPPWADGTVVDAGYYAATGGAMGAHGGEGKIKINYSEP